MERLLSRLDDLERQTERSSGLKYADAATTELSNQLRTQLLELVSIVRQLAQGVNQIGKKVG